MGFFDRFIVEAECPHCEDTVEFAFQTKALDQSMANYEKGDEVRVSGLSINGVVEEARTGHKCGEPEKEEIEDLIDEINKGMESSDWEKVRMKAQSIEDAIPERNPVYADIIIEDGIYREVENIRKERD